MALQSAVFHIESTPRGRQYWYNVLDSENFSLEDSKADIFIVPWEEFRGEANVFPEGTSHFFKFIREKMEGSSVGIGASRASYKEVALHANQMRLPTMILTMTLLPILTNVISDYIFERISTDDNEAFLEMELVIERQEGDCLSLKYRGHPNEILDTVVKNAMKCLEEGGYDESGR